MDLLLQLLAFALLIGGVLSIPFGVPGTVIIFAGIFLLAFNSGFASPFNLWFLAAMGFLTLIAETADNWLTMFGARKYGASRGSMWLSMVGGIVGAIFIGAPLAVVFGPLGPIVGGFAGAFLLVVAYEYRRLGVLKEALRAGWGAFIGRMAGILLKIIIAVAMVAVVVILLAG